jgi:hypothetical protein
MNRIATFYIGLGYKADGSTLNGVEDRVELIKTHAAQIFGGYSADRVNGGWHDGSNLVEEPALRIEVLTDQDASVIRQFAESAKIAFQQEAIALAVRPASISFV